MPGAGAASVDRLGREPPEHRRVDHHPFCVPGFCPNNEFSSLILVITN